MAQTPINTSTPHFLLARERKGSLSANSIRFNHTRSSSITSSIDEDILPRPAKISENGGTYQRGSFESLASSRASLLDEIDSPQRPLAQMQPRSPFFKNHNSSSSTLLPLTRTVSFNSVQNNDHHHLGSTDKANHSEVLQGGKLNKLARLFSSRLRSRNSETASAHANTTSTGVSGINGSSLTTPLSSASSPPLPNGSSNKNSTHSTPHRNSFSPQNSRSSATFASVGSDTGSINGIKSNLLQRQMSITRSIKEKRNLKKPADLSIQTSNLTGSSRLERPSPLKNRSTTDLGDVETLSNIPNLTGALVSSSAMSPQMATSSSLSTNSKPHKHHHLQFNHHNILRPRTRDTPLSSSSSNSKLISNTGETFYSFSMTGGNFSSSDLQRTFQQLEALNFKDLDYYGDKDVMGDECYSLLSFLLLPIFKGEPLKVPLEDLNRLVQLFLYLRIQEFHSSSTPTNASHPRISIFDELQLLLHQGFQKFVDTYVKPAKTNTTEAKVVKAWNVFMSQVFFYLEGVLLPLQLELEGVGSLIKPESYEQLWRDLTLEQDLSVLYVRRMILLSFRDSVIIPIYEDDEEENWFHEETNSSRAKEVGSARHDDKSVENKRNLLQCFRMLKSVDTKDSSQSLIERLLEDLIESWESRD